MLLCPPKRPYNIIVTPNPIILALTTLLTAWRNLLATACEYLSIAALALPAEAIAMYELYLKGTDWLIAYQQHLQGRYIQSAKCNTGRDCGRPISFKGKAVAARQAYQELYASSRKVHKTAPLMPVVSYNNIENPLACFTITVYIAAPRSEGVT